jgi:hypothetical protein
MEDDNTFEITIDFTPGEGDPTRVFKAMSGLVDALTALDSHLATSFDVSLDASLVLDKVEAGSIKGIFRDVISGVPDEAIKDAEWKKILGHYLLRAKYALLKWLDETQKISHRDDVRVLEGELLLAAEETDLKRIPAYAPPRTELLLSDVHAIRESLDVLTESDTATYSHGGKSVKFNRELEISNEIIRDILTKEVVKSSAKRIVKVKKPDYLGQSMWGLHYDGRAIDAKIADSDWLAKFQARQVYVRPGDSLRVFLYEEISYGYEGEIVHRYYEIEKVDGIIHPPTQNTIAF